MRFLLVEDDADIIRALSELLSKEGYEVDYVSTQDGAIAALNNPNKTYDLVLLDVTLKQGNGFAVCTIVKDAHPDLPIIFLTASDDEFNTVAGLTMGADDYIAKPFRPRELLARIQSVFRRRSPIEQNIKMGNVLIEPARARATKDGKDLELSAIEYRLLLLFATNQGRVVTREMIREALWEDAGAYVENNTLSVYVKRLRDKIEDDTADPRYILTVRGVGYRVQG